MVFSSLIFIYAFFPIFLLAYKLCKTKQAQNIILLVFSLIFYACGEPKYILLLMFMSLSSWYFALKIENETKLKKRRLELFISCAINLLLIVYFKYSSFLISIFTDVPEFISKIGLPLGISFYTFQLLSYVVDVYRNEVTAQKNYWNVLLYASLFHQCIAGPIVRYSSLSSELFDPSPRQPEPNSGVSRFCVGLAKKTLLANPCGALADRMLLSGNTLADAAMYAENLHHIESLSVSGAWLGILAYGLQIYLDFSAYSDMAIGMGRILGLHYPENFNYPYISRSIKEYWQRWHITLSSFFRDYVYIPLGGNRRRLPRVILNTFIVWFLTGLWHGANWNFILWGMWFFILIVFEKYILKDSLSKIPVLSNILTLFFVFLSWVFFRFEDINVLTSVLKTLFGLNNNAFVNLQSSIIFKNNMYLLIAAIIASTPLPHLLRLKTQSRAAVSSKLSNLYNIIFYSVIPVILLILSTASLVGDSYNPFIYFQF